MVKAAVGGGGVLLSLSVPGFIQRLSTWVALTKVIATYVREPLTAAGTIVLTGVSAVPFPTDNCHWFCVFIKIAKPVPLPVCALNTTQLNPVTFHLGWIQASSVKSVNGGEFAAHGILT